MTPEHDIALLPEEFDKLLGVPFGGLLGHAVAIRVVSQIVADPYSSYTTTDLAELSASSVPQVRATLASLVESGFLLLDKGDPSRPPTYRVNPASKRLIALTLFTYADLDDRHGSAHFNNAVLDYLAGEYRPRRGYSVMLYGLQPSLATSESRTNVAAVITNIEQSNRPESGGWTFVFVTSMGPAASPATLQVEPTEGSPGLRSA